MNVVNLLPLEADEKVSSMIRVPDFGGEDIKYLCMVTKRVSLRELTWNSIRISVRAVSLPLTLMKMMSSHGYVSRTVMTIYSLQREAV